MSELNREQKLAILDGERPKLTWPRSEPCPVEEGQTVKLEPRVWITVQRIRFSQSHWVAEYLVRDDRPRLLRAGLTPTVTRRSQRRHWTPAEEHGYTNHAGNALPDEPEAVSDDDLRRFRVKADERFAAHREQTAAEEEQIKQEKAIREQLKSAVRELDPLPAQLLLAAVQREIEKATLEEAA